MAVESRLLLLFILFHLFIVTINAHETIYDITKHGATPNGDATKGLTDAWKAACACIAPSKVLIPKGEYQLGPVVLEGPCKAKISMEILGNFKAPADAKAFAGADTWVKFEHINDLCITAPKGSGIFDGQGEQGWKLNDCTKNRNCGGLPYNFRFNFLNNTDIGGITSLNSKNFHMAVLGCNLLNLHDFTITAPENSPNTDGIHIGRSDGVNVTKFMIATGDDCVSFGDGSKNVLIDQVTCGPGHGISIGSLGMYPDEAPVTGITIRNCTVKNTSNGVRVKTWLNSYQAAVSSLHFEDIIVENVTFPIIVDQEYCPYNHCKEKIPSKVKISDIRFKNVKGTSATREAVKLICSSGAPCEKVELIDIDISYAGPDGPAVSMCKNVKPVVTGKMIPPACNAPPTTNVEI